MMCGSWRWLSTLNKWVKAFSEQALPAGLYQNLVRENDRLRREIRILKEEGELLKNSALFSSALKKYLR